MARAECKAAARTSGSVGGRSRKTTRDRGVVRGSQPPEVTRSKVAVGVVSSTSAVEMEEADSAGLGCGIEGSRVWKAMLAQEVGAGQECRFSLMWPRLSRIGSDGWFGLGVFAIFTSASGVAHVVWLRTKSAGVEWKHSTAIINVPRLLS